MSFCDFSCVWNPVIYQDFFYVFYFLLVLDCINSCFN